MSDEEKGIESILLHPERENYGEVQMIQLDLPLKKQEHWTLIGQAIAGTRSSLIVPQLGTVFDFGFCSLLGTQQELVCVTHGHADHMGALHFHVFERGMHNMKRPVYLMPGMCVPEWISACEAYQKLGGGKKKYNARYLIVGVGLGDLNQNLVPTPKGRYWIRGYRMRHSVPAIGYGVFETRKKLKEEYQGLEQKEIAKLVKSGEVVNVVYEMPVFAYSGDTIFRAILENPVFLQARISVIECTYLDLDPEETRSFAKKRAHVHILDIEENLDNFQCQYLILCHFSRRYKREQVLTRIEQLNQKAGDKLTVAAFI